jgi:hypothetical protein
VKHAKRYIPLAIWIGGSVFAAVGARIGWFPRQVAVLIGVAAIVVCVLVVHNTYWEE